MALGLNPFVKALMGSVFIFFLVFSFIGSFLLVTNPNSEILNSQYGLNDSIESLDSTLDSFTTISNNTYTQLADSEPSPSDFLFLIFKGAFYIPFAFVTFIFNSLKTISLILFPLFQGSGLGSILTIGLGLLISVLLVTSVLLIVKAMRTGETER